jgi:segregation and condensation protein B
MSEQDQNIPEDTGNSEESNLPEDNRNEVTGRTESHPAEGNSLRPESPAEEESAGFLPSEQPEEHVNENLGEDTLQQETPVHAGDEADREQVLDGIEEIVAGETNGEAGSESVVREEVVDDLAHIIESIIFASDEPLPVATIKSVLDVAHTFGRVHPDMITARINALNSKYENDGTGFYIVEIANGYQYATRKEMAQWVSNLFKERSKRRLSNSALETLAIIAYKQPITKPEIESIRGVNVDYVLHNLLEKEIVTVIGRAETVGRPLLYGSTQKFLKIFGLKNLEDLPKLREIEEIIKEIKSRGAEESIQLEITALGESSAPEPAAGPESGHEENPVNDTK